MYCESTFKVIEYTELTSNRLWFKRQGGGLRDEKKSDSKGRLKLHLDYGGVLHVQSLKVYIRSC